MQKAIPCRIFTPAALPEYPAAPVRDYCSGAYTIAASIAYPLFAWFEWGVVTWKEAIILSAIGWGLQFLGHLIEGNQPAFFQTPRFLIVGATYFLFRPLWRVLARLRDRSSHG